MKKQSTKKIKPMLMVDPACFDDSVAFKTSWTAFFSGNDNDNGS